MKKRPNVTIKILFKCHNEILILKHEGIFVFPGGRVEWEETMLESLKRELREELDYSLKGDLVLFDVWDQMPEDGKRHHVMIYYAQRLDEKPQFTALEGSKILWLTKEQFLDKGIIRNKEFLNKMFEDKRYDVR